MAPKNNSCAVPSYFPKDLDLPFDVTKVSDDGKLIDYILIFTVKEIQSKIHSTLKDFEDKKR